MKKMLLGITALGFLALACTTFGIPAALPATNPALSGTVTPTGFAPEAAAPGGSITGSDGSLAAIYGRVNPGVVAIFAYGAGTEGDALGSGFVVDMEGHIVTNMHVVSGAAMIEVDFPSGVMAEAEVIAEDPDSDLAVLRVDAAAEELHPLTLGDSALLRIGDPVIAIGNPYGLYNTLTTGIVSAKGRTGESMRESGESGFYLLGDMIQTDAAINPGNSGGPLLNLKGEVVGVNRSILTDSVTKSGNVVNSGLGFAISSNIVRRVLPSLIAKGKYDYPYLGLGGLSELHLQTVQALDLAYGYGVYVTSIAAGGPAAEAGLRAGTEEIPEMEGLLGGGDLILAINGQMVRNFAELISYIVLNAAPGDSVYFTVSRGGGTEDISVVLGSRP
jgi:S1-C subfamily serine protease